MADSCKSGESWLKGIGSRDSGRSEANAGNEIRLASGAVVWGINVAEGAHGAVEIR